MKVPFVIIGGGLSGLAAAIRFARYSPDVLLLEKHHRVGGLNSYYYRKNILLETGLHAITNFAPAEEKRAPFNKLLRQLKLRRKDLKIYPQTSSEIHFPGPLSLLFSNDFKLLKNEIEEKFPYSRKGFAEMVRAIDDFDPFIPVPFRSAKKFILGYLQDERLTEMMLCPLMYYGSSVENDMDLSQFVIMFRSLFQEGMFRPEGTIKTFLDMLCTHLDSLGGTIRLSCGVRKILLKGDTAWGVELDNGERVECDYLLSTVGLSETYELLGKEDSNRNEIRLGFFESIFLLDGHRCRRLPRDRTIIFFNRSVPFNYARPTTAIAPQSGVLCLPGNFQGRPEQQFDEVRMTHLASYDYWRKRKTNPSAYAEAKEEAAQTSLAIAEDYIGPLSPYIVFQDSFTPMTIRKYTSKKQGAIYGCPTKVKDGTIGLSNVFIAGTDQGFLGIVGSMLSGVSIVNQHILPRL